MSIQIPSAKSGCAPTTVENAVFGAAYNEPLVHQLVVAYQAAGRSGTKRQKSRAEVSGGGAKPWKQKGSGRARAGTTRGPIWRTGGVTFAARNRSFDQKVNKKMYRAAMRSIFSELVREGRLCAIDAISLNQPKTRELVEELKKIDFQSGLIIIESFDERLYLSARNLPGVIVAEAKSISPVDLVCAPKIIVTDAAIKVIEENLG